MFYSLKNDDCFHRRYHPPFFCLHLCPWHLLASIASLYFVLLNLVVLLFLLKEFSTGNPNSFSANCGRFCGTKTMFFNRRSGDVSCPIPLFLELKNLGSMDVSLNVFTEKISMKFQLDFMI